MKTARVSYGGWAYKPLLRDLSERSVGPALDVFQRSLDDRWVIAAILRPSVTMDVFDAATGQRACTIERPWDDVESLTADVCGARLLLSLQRREGPSPLELIDLATGATDAVISHPTEVRFVGMLHGGRYAVTTERFEDRVESRVYNLDRAHCLQAWPRPVEDMSPRAMAVSFADGGILRWSPLDGEGFGTLKAPVCVSIGDGVVAPLRISSDERAVLYFNRALCLVCADALDGTETVFDPVSLTNDRPDAGFWRGSEGVWVQRTDLAVVGSSHTQSLGGSGDCTIAASREGAAIWAARHRGLFDGVETERLLPGLSGHSGRVYTVALGDDGAVVSTGADGWLRVWNPDGVERWSVRSGAVCAAWAHEAVVSVEHLGELAVHAADHGEERTRMRVGVSARWRQVLVTRDARCALVLGDAEGGGAWVLWVALDAKTVVWQRKLDTPVRRAQWIEGSREVTLTGDDGQMTALRADDGGVVEQAHVFTERVRGGDLFFVHNGRYALCLRDGGPMTLVDTVDASVRWRRSDLTADLRRVVVAPDGRLFATALRGALAGRIVLRRVETGAVVEEIDLGVERDRPMYMAFSDDSRGFAVGTLRGVVLRYDLVGLAD